MASDTSPIEAAPTGVRRLLGEEDGVPSPVESEGGFGGALPTSGSFTICRTCDLCEHFNSVMFGLEVFWNTL